VNTHKQYFKPNRWTDIHSFIIFKLSLLAHGDKIYCILFLTINRSAVKFLVQRVRVRFVWLFYFLLFFFSCGSNGGSGDGIGFLVKENHETNSRYVSLRKFSVYS